MIFEDSFESVAAGGSPPKSIRSLSVLNSRSRLEASVSALADFETIGRETIDSSSTLDAIRMKSKLSQLYPIYRAPIQIEVEDLCGAARKLRIFDKIDEARKAGIESSHITQRATRASRPCRGVLPGVFIDDASTFI